MAKRTQGRKVRDRIEDRSGQRGGRLSARNVDASTVQKAGLIGLGISVSALAFLLVVPVELMVRQAGELFFVLLFGCLGSAAIAIAAVKRVLPGKGASHLRWGLSAFLAFTFCAVVFVGWAYYAIHPAEWVHRRAQLNLWMSSFAAFCAAAAVFYTWLKSKPDKGNKK